MFYALYKEVRSTSYGDAWISDDANIGFVHGKDVNLLYDNMFIHEQFRGNQESGDEYITVDWLGVYESDNIKDIYVGDMSNGYLSPTADTEMGPWLLNSQLRFNINNSNEAKLRKELERKRRKEEKEKKESDRLARKEEKDAEALKKQEADDEAEYAEFLRLQKKYVKNLFE
jgi:hypothetical protein